MDQNTNALGGLFNLTANGASANNILTTGFNTHTFTSGGHAFTLNDTTGNIGWAIPQPPKQEESNMSSPVLPPPINKANYSTWTLGGAPASDLASDILRKQISDLEKKCKDLQQENHNFESAINGYEMSQEKLEEKLENQRHNYTELQEAHDALRKVLDGMPDHSETWNEYDRRIQDLEDALKDRNARLAAVSENGQNKMGLVDDNGVWYDVEEDEEFFYVKDAQSQESIRKMTQQLVEDELDQIDEEFARGSSEVSFENRLDSNLEMLEHPEVRERVFGIVADAVHACLDERAAVADKPAEVPAAPAEPKWDDLTVEQKTEKLSNGRNVWRASKGDGPFRTVLTGVVTPPGKIGSASAMACHDRNGKEHIIPVTDLLIEKPAPFSRPSMFNLVNIGIVSSAAAFYPAYLQFGFKGGLAAVAMTTVATLLQCREFSKAI